MKHQITRPSQRDEKSEEPLRIHLTIQGRKANSHYDTALFTSSSPHANQPSIDFYHFYYRHRPEFLFNKGYYIFPLTNIQQRNAIFYRKLSRSFCGTWS